MTCMRPHLERTVYFCVEERAGYNYSLSIANLGLIEKPTVYGRFEIGICHLEFTTLHHECFMVSKSGNLNGIESEHQMVIVMKWVQSNPAAKYCDKKAEELLRCSHGESEVYTARYIFCRRAILINYYVQARFAQLAYQ